MSRQEPFPATNSFEEGDELRAFARAHLAASAQTTAKASETTLDSIHKATTLITACFRAGKKVLICGNGGSAADAQHMAAEFVNRLSKDFERPGLPAISLTTDTSFLTSYANDYGYDGVFERQVRALGQAEDVLIGISTSGNSRNVISAIRGAREIGLVTIGLGGSDGEMATLVDCCIAVPSRETQHIQETLLAIEHVVCLLVERNVFSNVK